MKQKIKHNDRRMAGTMRLFALVLGVLALWGCRDTGSTIGGCVVDSTLCDSIEPCASDAVFAEESPEPSFSRFGNDIHKVYRNLSDSEIENLDFDGYQMSSSHKVLLDSWKEEVEEHRPYYSIVTCPLCEHHLLVVYGSSPQKDWETLCGRAGYLAICTRCRQVLDFELVVMN